MKNYAKIFGANLESEMNKFGITQVELADRMLLTNSAISNYILGNRIPRVETIIELCEMLDISMDYMFGLTNDKNVGYTIGVEVTKEIPILKTLHANDPINASDNIEKMLQIVTRQYKNPDKLFGLRVKCDNMFPRIHQKDLLIVERITPNDKIENGDICIIAKGNEEAVPVELTPTENGMFFNSYNLQMPPKFYNWDEIRTHQIQIIGKVVELRKNFD